MRLSKLVVVPIVALGLVLPACGSSGGNVSVACDVLGGSNDINPTDVSELQDGGNLRLAISLLPPNYNALHIDGNLGEAASIYRWMLPRAYRTNAAGELSLNTDFFTGAELTGTDPQQVTFTLNPKAVWSDGTPITWEDLAAQAKALKGDDPGYRVANTSGFERVEKVERGVDDKQAIFTFSTPYAEWQGLFAGNSMLYPKSVTSTPEAFDTSLLDGLPITGGPFMIDTIDKVQNRIILKRNPLWWGDTPKLDSVTYTVMASDAGPQALQNNEIDAVGLGTIDELQLAQDSPGVVIRCAPGLSFSHLTFNGAEGSILADPALRTAIAKGIDRDDIAQTIQNGIVAEPEALDNHVYLRGQDGYQDNSGVVAFDPAQAETELDALGWVRNGDVREKDGRKLEIRLVLSDIKQVVDLGKIVQQQLAAIGVKVNIDARPSVGFFDQVIQPGNFDIACFAWSGDAFPLSSLYQVYGLFPDDLQGNYGRIGSPELNAKIEQAVQELDHDKAKEMANEIDKDIWTEVHSLTLLQSAGNVGVRDTLANYGAAGLASLDYTKVGFKK